jgi:alkanesulfonate monooxygenase SsuD/methylene tetrahydromethanopterin reductase-like flavin-dependent oxidoreductase (luciferase family)
VGRLPPLGEIVRLAAKYVRAVRVGVLILPEHHWPDAAEKWSRAEALGFDHAWTFDHIAWRELRDSTWFAAVPTLAAAAAVTSTIRIGTLVASPNFRHPVPFARELLTLDDISGGRLTVGIGAGAEGWDTTVLGQEPWGMSERQERFAEFVDLLDQLLVRREVSFTGRYWTAHEARTYPGCVQRPRVPFAIAATGPRSMRVAAKHASVWVTNGDRSHEGPPLAAPAGAEVVARQLRDFERACEAVDRDPVAIDKLVLTGPRLDSGLQSSDDFATVVSAYEQVGVTDIVVPWPRPEPPYEGIESVLEEIGL